MDLVISIFTFIGIIAIVIAISFWVFLTFISLTKDDEFSKKIQYVNQVIVIILSFYLLYYINNYEKVDITYSNVMSYIDDTSDDYTEIDTIEWYYNSPYYKDEYTDDTEFDIIDAYEDGVKKGIEFSDRYYNSIR